MRNLTLLSDLMDRAKRGGATASDAVMFASTDLSVSARMGKPEGLERAESSKLGLRVFVGDKQAFVSTTDTQPKTLADMVERAVAMAKASPPDPYSTLAPKELLAREFPDLDLADAGEPSAAWMQEQCRIAEDTALSIKGISNSEGADANFSAHTITLATSNGFAHSYRTTSSALSVSVLAGDGTTMERDYDYSAARHVSDLRGAQDIGKKAAELALRRLNPRKISTATLPVVFDPRVGRSLLSSFASAISGAAIARGTSFLKDHLHKKLFPETITVIDDPHRVRGLASRPFDGEGVQNKKQSLVDKGILTGWLLDMRSANKLGLKTTGHAARGVGSPPSPSSTNLYMAAGTLSPAALIADIKQGLYVTEAFGMGVNLITGDYSQGASGLMIENGQLAYPVSEITIAGHLLAMFAGVTAADDLEFRYGTNTPTLRIEGMMVAGK